MTRTPFYSDEPILVRGLELALRQAEEFELLPSCSTLAGLTGQMARSAPDLVLMDLTPEVTFAPLVELKHAVHSRNRLHHLLCEVNLLSRQEVDQLRMIMSACQDTA